MTLQSKIDIALAIAFGIFLIVGAWASWHTALRKPEQHEIQKWEARDFYILTARSLGNIPLRDKPTIIIGICALLCFVFGLYLAAALAITNIVYGWVSLIVLRKQKLHFPEKEAEFAEFINNSEQVRKARGVA